MSEMDAWIADAKAVDIGAVAAMLNLTLKGRGEMVGPCPICGGKDRFAVNVKKQVFNCRGCAKGGDAIGLAQHALGCDFIAACEFINGKPSPRGGGKSMSSEERAERDLRLAVERAKKEKAAAAEQKKRRQSAGTIWKSTIPLRGTLAAEYIRSRGLDPALADGGELRAHAGLQHPDGLVFPALIARVADVDNKGIGVWRIFVANDGRGKADVASAKLGLGVTAGGAVRIGGVEHEIGLAEGVETALACRQMVFADTGRMMPVWSCLSTSGLRGVVLPPQVQSVRIFADADAEKLLRGEARESPGIAAAQALERRLIEEGRRVVVQVPPVGMDWLDTLKATQDAVAA